MSDIIEDIFSQLLEKGVVLHYVDAEVSADGVPYAYTIGRSIEDAPELIIRDLPAEPSEAVLKQLLGYRPVLNEVIQLPGAHRKCRMVETDAGALLGAVATFGSMVTALEVTWE